MLDVGKLVLEFDHFLLLLYEARNNSREVLFSNKAKIRSSIQGYEKGKLLTSLSPAFSEGDFGDCESRDCVSTATNEGKGKRTNCFTSFDVALEWQSSQNVHFRNLLIQLRSQRRPFLAQLIDLRAQCLQLLDEACRYRCSIGNSRSSDDRLLTDDVLNGREVLSHKHSPTLIEVLEMRGMLDKVVEDCDEIVSKMST